MSKIQELEEEYQRNKVLSSGVKEPAEIADVWIDTRPPIPTIYMVLRRSDDGLDIVEVSDLYDPEDRNDLIAVFQGLGCTPKDGLNGLRKETVEVSYEPSGNERYSRHNGYAVLNCGSQSVKSKIVNEGRDFEECSSTLPEHIQSDLFRGYWYASNDDNVASVTVNDLSIENDELVVQLGNKRGEFKITIQESRNDNPQSTYERLVEYVGQGSVMEIVGSQIFLTHIGKVRSSGDEYVNEKEESIEQSWESYITTDQSSTGRWIITASEPPVTSDRQPYKLAIGCGVLLVILSLDPILGSSLLFFTGLAGISAIIFMPEPFVASK